MERLLVTEHLELHQPVPVEQLAGEPARAHRTLRVVTARGVGKNREPVRRQIVEQVRLAGVLTEVRAPDGDGDDLRAACLDRGPRLFEIPVLPGTDEQAGTILDAGDGQGPVRRSTDIVAMLELG